ncbi:MAG TPA: hypothetical protein VMX17_02730 [Candidatus Glassbacteria bacterium]|nr:hypothetical protein [Candidatus Glassbacteria bacterium]
MSYKYLVSKIAADKEGNKLGKIIGLDRMPGKTIKKMIPYLLIRFEKRFRKDIIVPIEAEKVLEAKGSYVWFNITKEQFDQEVDRIRKTKLDRETYKGYQQFKQTRGGAGNVALDISGLSHKSKERKR